MPDRIWLAIALGLLLIAVIMLVAICTAPAPATPGAQTGPEIEEVYSGRDGER
jgi:hypothetical protein